jgi:hypothetical protein
MTAEDRKNFMDFRQCPAFCLEAAKVDGFNLSYVPDKYKNEKISLAAVKQNGLAIKCVPPLRLTKNMVREAVRQNPRALFLIGEEWRLETVEGEIGNEWTQGKNGQAFRRGT